VIVTNDFEVRVGARTLLTAPKQQLRVQPGDRIGLVGRNGAGKTTTMRILAGETEPYGGSVTRSGEIGYLPQDSREGNLEQTARDRVLSARGLDTIMRNMDRQQEIMETTEDPRRRDQAIKKYARLEERYHSLGGYEGNAEAAQICDTLGLPARVLDQPLKTLSGGQRRRVELAQILFAASAGSGKSTTMKLLLGLMKPTAGEVFINGRKLTKASRPELLGRVGSMIEAPPGYGHLTGWENLQIVQSMLGLEERQIIQALDIVRLTKNKDKLVKNYSLGMKQRLGIAMALAREPELLILDEPTNGLDPAGIEEIRSLIIHLAQQGITIMVSSHLLDEIDKMASVLGIINNGTLIFQGSREELSGQSIPDFVIETDQAGRLQNFPGARMLSPTTVSLSNLSKDDGAHLLGELHAVGARVFEAYRASQSLEDIFMKLTAQGQLQ